MILTQNFTLDIVKPPLNRLRLVNGDTANKFVVTIKNNGSAVTLDATLHKIIAVFTRADGEVYTQDASCGVTFTTLGVVTIDLRPASFRTGTNKLALQIYKRENSSATEYPLLLTTQEQSFNARAAAIPEAGAPNAPSQLPMLEKYVDECRTYANMAEEAVEQQVIAPSITAWMDDNESFTQQIIEDEFDGWLDDHPEATTTVQDGAITLAKLHSSLTVLQTVVDSFDWQQGGINSAAGGVTVSSTRVRGTIGLITADTQTLVFDGYDAMLFKYTTDAYSTSVYEGSNGSWIEGGKADLSDYIGKYVRVCLRYHDNSEITPSDISGVKVTKTAFTDTSLSLTGKAADAKTVGDRIANVENTIGEIVTANFTKPSSGNAVKNFEYPIKAGRTIKFYWTGENVASNDSLNLYTRATSSGSNIETLKATAKADTIYEVTPTVDANYLRVVATKTGTISVYENGTIIDYVTGLERDVEQLEEAVAGIPETPFVRFGFSHDMYDPSEIFGETGEIGSISGWSSKAEALSKVHAAFDALCASGGAGYGYGERITGLYKESESNESILDLLAPDYVTQGVVQGQTVVLPIGTDSGGNPVTYNYTYESSTQPYEVRLYRFCDTNSALHTATVDIPKKKILLVGGTHGNEFCAPINLYVLAKHLCSDYTNPDVLKLRSSFDVYIVPYLNGFGCQYQWSNGGTMTTGSRSNGRMVDINRNCYTSGWVGATGTAEQITAHFEGKIANLATNTFAGSSNGSEFESQLIKGLIEYLQPDVFVDHHHNSGNTPFYATCRGDFAGNLIYQAANDTAYARIHNMPEYFGTKYNLFLGSDVSPATKSAENGHMDTMAYELGIKMNAVQEMPESIAYLNGVVDSATKTATKYSALAFRQAEYTLLNVLLHFCQWALEH